MVYCIQDMIVPVKDYSKEAERQKPETSHITILVVFLV